jgi:hypothetical protein
VAEGEGVMRKMLAATVAFGAVMAGGVAIVGGVGAQAQAPPAADAATAQEAVAAAALADSVRWGRCADPTLVEFGARCATVQVPLDYSKPNGKTIGIAVSRIRHTVPDSQYQGRAPKWSTWRDDSWRIYANAPFMVWNNTWFNAPCFFWPAKSENPIDINGQHVPGVLLLGETKDAATPFEGSLEVRSRFPNSSLIASPGGTTHAASLNGNACVDNQIAAYLASGALPPRKSGRRADATCPPLPQPVPGQAAAAAAMSAEAAAGVATPTVRERLRAAAGPVRLPGG